MAARKTALACTLALWLGAGLARAKPGDVARGIPEGALVFGHWMHNPERDFLKPYYEDVWKALRDSGAIEEVVKLVTSKMPDEQREALAAQWEGWKEAILKVDWDAFLAHEIVLGLRPEAISPDVPIPIPLVRVLARVDAGPLRANLGAVGGLLARIAALEPDALQASVVEEGGTKWAFLRVVEAPVPFGLYFAGEGETFAFGLTRASVEESLRLVRGETQVAAGAPAPLLESARFTGAFQGLPKPEDGRAFADMHALLAYYGRLLDVIAMMPAGQPGPPEKDRAVAAVRQLLNALDVADTVASVSTTEGPRLHTRTVTRMREGWEQGPVYRIAGGRTLPAGFGRWIPATATSFSAGAGIDLVALYRELLGFVEANIPEAKEGLEAWSALQKQWNFDLERDLLSWIEGTVIFFGVSAAVQSPLGGSGDGAFLLAVRDAARAQAKIDEWIGLLLKKLPGDQPLLQRADVVGLEGFHSLVFVPLPFVKPVYGVWKGADDKAGVLILGMSENAVRLALATRKGEGKDLREHVALKELGGLPGGPICAVSYTDLKQAFAGLAQLGGMVTMITASMPENEKTRPVKQALSILPRLAPVLYKLRFLEASASVTTYDPSSRTYRQHKVVRTAGPKEEAPAEEAPPTKKEARL